MIRFNEGVTLTGPANPNIARTLTPDAIAFFASLHRNFNQRRLELLAMRTERQSRLDAGDRPDFLPETAQIRRDDWTVSRLPQDLLDRRVEITGPTDRKMIINALNSGAKVFMADFEDSTTPTWQNVIDGQINLQDAVRRTISFHDGNTGKSYRLIDEPATLFVRPRGWHMEEAHVLVDGDPVSASLFDFGLYVFHNAKELLNRGTGPYFYLPKLESHLEARLWNNVFVYAERGLGIPAGSIKATVLIETILAAFEMDEILWELREHSAGLNCGRWDYIFSFIKKFAANTHIVLPDRNQITMVTHFLRSYSKLAIRTCHRRGVHAMGGMSALIPIKHDSEANERAIAGVRADKEREASDGHDGTWVAHPGLVPVAMEVFNWRMPQPNQIDKKLSEFEVTAADLLEIPGGQITAAGLRQNVAVAIGYVESWLRGIGCVPLFNLMEDAATAEISRAQLWQWVHHRALREDGVRITTETIDSVIDEERRNSISLYPHRAASYSRAIELTRELIRAPRFPEFLTTAAYSRILTEGL